MNKLPVKYFININLHKMFIIYTTIYLNMDCKCMLIVNSRTPGVISAKFGTHTYYWPHSWGKIPLAPCTPAGGVGTGWNVKSK